MLSAWANELFGSREAAARRARRDERERLALLRELKNAVQATVEYASAKAVQAAAAAASAATDDDDGHDDATAEAPPAASGHAAAPHSGAKSDAVNACELDERDPVIQDLLLWLERCLWHGMRQQAKVRVSGPAEPKVRTVKVANPSLWHLVFRLQAEAAKPDQGAAARSANLNARLAATISDVRELLFVKSDLGRGRAWLRVALNHKVLDAALLRLREDDRDCLIGLYEDGALLRDDEACIVLASLLTGLNGLEIRTHVDVDAWDAEPAPARHMEPEEAKAGSTSASGALAQARGAARPAPAPGLNVAANIPPAVGLQATPSMANPTSWATAFRTVVGRATSAISGPAPQSPRVGGDIAARSLHQRAQERRRARASHLAKLEREASTLFQRSLQDIATNPFNSALAQHDARVAVPNALLRCVALLWTAAETAKLTEADVADLFVIPSAQRAGMSELAVHLRQHLRDLSHSGLTILARVDVDLSLSEAMSSIAANTRAGFATNDQHLLQPKVVAALLRILFPTLTDPLVPFQAFEPLLQCVAIEDEEGRIRNIRCLIETFPPAHQVALDLVLQLLARLVALHPGTTVALTRGIATSLIRPPPALTDHDHETRPPAGSIDSAVSNAARHSSSDIVEALAVLVRHHETIMEPIRLRIRIARQALCDKLARVRRLGEGLTRPVTADDTEQGVQQRQALESVWNKLGPSRASGDDDDTDNGTDDEHGDDEQEQQGAAGAFALVSSGWKRRGFSGPDAAAEFRNGGETALFDLAYFCERHGKKARLMIRAGQFPLVRTACQVSRMAAECLGITSQEFASLGPAGNHIVAQPWWHMLNEPDAAHRVFCMAFLLLDLNLNEASSSAQDLDQVVADTKMQMSDLLALGPASVNQLWHSWIQLRAERMLWQSPAGPKEAAAHVAAPAVRAGAGPPGGAPPPLPSRLPQGAGHSSSSSRSTSSSSSDSNSNSVVSNMGGATPPTPPSHPAHVAAAGTSSGGTASPAGQQEHQSQVVSVDELLPRLVDQSAILTMDHVAKLEAALPQSYHGYDWKMVFSSDRDGADINDFFRQAKPHSATLLLVKDTKGASFGGFAATAWEVSGRYTGTGECFLFRLEPEFATFHWSEKNSYFILSNEDSLAFGGGGEFGLFLDEDLQSGTSGPCETFDSPCLASDPEFAILAVELWTFQTRLR